MFVFSHIPKSAGTAIGEAFDYSTQRRVFWDYDSEYRFAQKIQPEIEQNLGFISSYYRVIFGHFYVTKYLPVLPQADYLTCVRHPVDRVISQYHHVAHEAKDWQGQEIAQGKMDVVEFARQETICSAQTIHLAGLDLQDFGHVFITERLDTSIKAFEAKFDFRFFVGVKQVNTKQQREAHSPQEKAKEDDKVVPVTEAQKQEVFSLTTQDNDLYRRAVEMHKDELSRL